jgi:hypothetical protein
MSTSGQRAKSSGGYLTRLVILSVAFLGWAAWSLYDGAVVYPRQRERALAFQQFKDDGRIDEWPAFAAGKGWDDEDPGRPKNHWDIGIQYGMAGIALPIGAVFAFALLRSVGRWIEMRDDRFVTSGGEECRFDSITAIDKTRWDEKGIAVVHYQADGFDHSLVLDDWKFERPPIDAMVAKVDEVLKAKSPAAPGAPAAPSEG